VQKASCNGIELAYESFGDPTHPPLVLVMGFTMQMVAWADAFCAQLVGKGYYVIRFDNRDVGHSTKITSGPKPNVMAALSGDVSSASYALEDMADDTAGLLDALGIGRAHVVGVSMGGMISQLLAIKHPKRVRSLCSIMSTTGDRTVGQARPDVLPILMMPPPPDRDGNITARVAVARAISSPGFPFDEQRMRDMSERSYDRDNDPKGAVRQLLAILAARDRTADLAKITAPTVVIHGADDPLINKSGGEATARAIPNAQLVLIPGMGHDLPEGAWPQIIDAIDTNARRA
jgi:pimeloyl-ACP methyl ester carboxylesterase